MSVFSLFTVDNGVYSCTFLRTSKLMFYVIFFIFFIGNRSLV